MSLKGSSASLGDLEADRARWRTAVAQVLAKSAGRDGGSAAEPGGCWIRPPTKASRSVRSTPAWTRRRSTAARAMAVRAGQRRAARRQVGWRVAEEFPTGQSLVADGNGAVVVALTEGVSALVLRVGQPGGVAPVELDRLLEVSSSTWCRSFSMRARITSQRPMRCWRCSPT